MRWARTWIRHTRSSRPSGFVTRSPPHGHGRSRCNPPGTFALRHVSGEAAVDPSNASSLALLDPRTRSGRSRPSWMPPESARDAADPYTEAPRRSER